MAVCAAPSTSSSLHCKCGTQITHREYVHTNVYTLASGGTTADATWTMLTALVMFSLCNYDGPQGFSALVIRFQTPKASLLVYKSGKVCTQPCTSIC